MGLEASIKKLEISGLRLSARRKTGSPLGINITIRSEFRPDFTWWQSKRVYRFQTVYGPDGKLIGLPQAISN
jgi:hypothetical protein